MSIRRYGDVKVGEKASFRKTVTEADAWAFGAISGDFNPVHMDESFPVFPGGSRGCPARLFPGSPAKKGQERELLPGNGKVRR